MRRFAWLFIALLGVLPGVLPGAGARGTTLAAGEDGGHGPKVIYRKSEEQRYAGSRLKGQLKKPELSYIYQRKGLRAERIVNVPQNFDEEIIRGAGQF